MNLLFLALFCLFPLKSMAQRDMASLKGNFIKCQGPDKNRVFNQKNLRPNYFTCPHAQGYVLQDTPVKQIKVSVTCLSKAHPHGKVFPIQVKTSPDCNTIGCLLSLNKLDELAISTSPDIFKQNDSNKCHTKMMDADLFEYYPFFSTSGPDQNELFLETMSINNEDDPDYLSRINGGFKIEDLPSVNPLDEIQPADSQTNIISTDDQSKICDLESLNVLKEEEQNKYVKIIKTIYQSPEYSDDKLQRRSFCLLKDYYEKREDYDSLLDLIGNMKIDKEDCKKK